MKMISCRPSFSFPSFKKKPRSATSSSSPSLSTDTKTPSDSPKISRQQLELILRQLQPQPPTEQELSEMLAQANLRANGEFMTVDEIAALGLDEAGGLLSSPDLRETFAVFDGDGDGKISAEELRGVFVVLGDEACTIENCRRMIGGVDVDGDGFVCFDEFARMMRGQR